MAVYLRKINPYKHLITTRFTKIEYAEIWHIQNIDLSQSRLHNMPNFADQIPKIIEQYRLDYHKPHVIGEFGSDYRGPKETRANDQELVEYME